MFAWSGRASDAATIDAAVVGGNKRLATAIEGKGAANTEQRRKEQMLPSSSVLTSYHPPASSRRRQTRLPTLQTATSWRSHINDELNLEPCTTVRNHIIQYVFYDSFKAVTPFYVHFARR